MGYINDFALQTIATQRSAVVCDRDNESRRARLARGMYDGARLAARLYHLWARLTSKATWLQDLSKYAAHMSSSDAHYTGIRSVPLALIRGSEGRSHDFDARFNPLRLSNESRWLSVAMARLKGVTLPPVALIQVGDTYYVRDGHHRISVAHALGERDIDAEVLVWGDAFALSAEGALEHPHYSPQMA
jgi:hypothetical protein